jgi:hypothetical protein
MQRFLFALILVFVPALWGETVPLNFTLYAQSMGTVYVNATSASGGLDVCQFPSSSCSPTYTFFVGTHAGTVESWTTLEGGMPTLHQIGNFGPGGNIEIYYNHTFFLSGYLLYATATATTTTYGSWESYEKFIQGEFVATALNSDYWGNTDPSGVGGSFSILTGFPHSPFATGGGYLTVGGAPTPEPSSLTLLFIGAAALSRRWWKRSK